MNPEAFSGPKKILRWSFLPKKLTTLAVHYFSKKRHPRFSKYVLNTEYCSEYVSISVNYFRKELHVWLGFEYVSDIKYYFRLGETLNQNIYSDGCWEVFSKKAALENLYFLKYILKISYCNKDKITAKYRIGVILKMSKLRNDF